MPARSEKNLLNLHRITRGAHKGAPGRVIVSPTILISQLMGVLDILFIILLAGGAVLGFRKGAISQVASIVAIVAAIIACRAAGPWAVGVVGRWLDADAPGAGTTSSYVAQGLGYALLFAVVWFGVWLIARFFRQAFHAIRLGLIDRIAGSAFLVFKWFLVVSIMLNLWKFIDPDSGLFATSRLAGGEVLGGVLALAPWVAGSVRDIATNTAPELFSLVTPFI